MQKEIDAGEFIEHAEFSGNMYGTRYVTVTLYPIAHVDCGLTFTGYLCSALR